MANGIGKIVASIVNPFDIYDYHRKGNSKKFTVRVYQHWGDGVYGAFIREYHVEFSSLVDARRAEIMLQNIADEPLVVM